MDKLNSVFQNFKERLSNPLIFSFFISWVFINWQITVGLLWYDTKQIEETGCNSIFEFISDKLSFVNTFCIPISFALAYTLLMPIIRNLINALNAWATKWGDNWDLKILDHSKIPYEKYINLRNDYDKRTKILEEVILREGKFSDEFNSVKTELIDSKNELNNLTKSLIESNEVLNQQKNIGILNGYWTSIILNGVYKTEQDIYISDGRYYLVEGFNNMEQEFHIRHFHYDLKSKNVFFIKERTMQKELYKELSTANGVGSFRFYINNLNFNFEGNLVGQENGINNIEYKKKPHSEIKI